MIFGFGPAFDKSSTIPPKQIVRGTVTDINIMSLPGFAIREKRRNKGPYHFDGNSPTDAILHFPIYVWKQLKGKLKKG